MNQLDQEPKWITLGNVLDTHRFLIEQFGGSYGIRDQGLLESALARPQQIWAYEVNPTIPRLASAYIFGISKNHAFVDGNKRVSFAIGWAFLRHNGLTINASQEECYQKAIEISCSYINEEDLTRWIEDNIEPYNR